MYNGENMPCTMISHLDVNVIITT